MKKFQVVFIIIILTILCYFTVNYSSFSKEIIIKKTLNSEAYSYLGEEAKELVKDSYLETGEFILTEKNKEENTPYLNPKYLKYLELSDEEKENISFIPDMYSVDYKMKEYNDGSSLPSKYDLTNVDGKVFVTPQQHQGQLNLCWSFATLEQAESLLLVNSNTSYSSSSTIFSKRHLDYASSTDGIKDYNNTLGSRNLLDGGNYMGAIGPLVVGAGFVEDSYMTYNTSSDKRELSEILNYNNSKYELNSAIVLPTLASNASTDEKESYKVTIKELVKNYGGVFVGTEGPGSCGSNYNGSYFIRVDDNCNHNSPHAMQIIGWDDNYTYSYCKGSGSHSSDINNCAQSNIVSGTGAWLVRNSWGNSYAFIYLTYDSGELEIYTTTDISSMSNRSWDNVYPYTANLMSFYYANRATSTFQRNVTNKEKIEKIKIFTILQGGDYKLSINTGEQTYNNIKQFSIEYPGVYTIDLSEDNIYLNSDSFSISITSTNGALVKDGLSVFTSNVNSTPIIESDTKSLSYNTLENNVSFRLYTITRNINSNSLVNYKLKKNNGTDYSNYLTVSNNVVAKNDVNPLLTINKNIPNGSYNIEISNSTALLNIPLTIGNGDSLVVNYYANDNSNNSTIQSVNSSESFNIISNPFTRLGYIFNNWNTLSNGTGTSYSENDSISIISDLNLYAQWSPITYQIKYNSNGGIGSMSNQTFTYDTRDKLTKSSFTKKGYIFNKWNTLSNGSGISYTDEESILNLTSRNNEIINLYAQYQPITYKVRFNSNGGSGNMSDQSFTYDVGNNLNTNKFTRSGYVFSHWNTEADDSGTSYNNLSYVNNLSSTMNDVVILYAIWEEKVSIEYEINGYSVDEDELIIDLIDVKTTKSEFLSHFDTDDNYSVTIDLGNKNYIFTGSKTKIYMNGNLYKEFTNVVRGDINGDGKMTALDYVKVKNHIMGTTTINDDIYILSADINQDKKITALDYVRIKNYIMNGGN